MASSLSNLVGKCKIKYKEEDLKEQFPRIYKFCKGDINKFILFLEKGVYPYKYMDDWEKFNKTS